MKYKSIALYVFVTLLTFCLYTNSVNAADYTNYFGIEMTNTQYNNLYNQGFSEDEIYYMNEETFNENKDLTASLESVNSKYYKSIYTDLNGIPQTVEITESEYNNGSNNLIRGWVETEYKRMDAYITKRDNTYFRYKVTVNWKSMPSVRSYDIIGLAFTDDLVTIVGNVRFQFNYCVSNGTCYADGTFYNKQKKYNGGSAVYKLPTNAVSLSSTLYFDVAKNTTDTITMQLIHGDYAHATSNVSSSIYNNHNMTTGGLSLGTSAPYYDAIPCADTGWTGTW
jgi:hypothetical protein